MQEKTNPKVHILTPIWIAITSPSMLMKRLKRNRDVDSNEMDGLNEIDPLNHKLTNPEVVPKIKTEEQTIISYVSKFSREHLSEDI